MQFYLQTLLGITFTLIALYYVIRIFKNRKENLDFPIHIFVAGAPFVIALTLTSVHIVDIAMRWTTTVPTVQGTCVIDYGKHMVPIKVEENDLTLLSPRYLDHEGAGTYYGCEASYYPATKFIIDYKYDSYLDTHEY